MVWLLNKKNREAAAERRGSLRYRMHHAMERVSEEVAPTFFGSQSFKSEADKTDDDHRYDGLIRTAGAWYRAFQDENGATVLLMSYERQPLIPEKNEKGEWRLPDDKRVYVVAAYEPGIDVGPLLYRMIQKNDEKLQNTGLDLLNLISVDLTDQVKQKDPDNPKRVVKLANGEFAYGITERKDGRFDVRIYVANEHVDPAKIDHLMNIDQEMKHPLIGKMFSLGQKIGTFDTYDEARAFAFKDWAKSPDSLEGKEKAKNDSRAHKIWSGRSPLSRKDKLAHPLKHAYRKLFLIGKGMGNMTKGKTAKVMAVVLLGVPVLFTTRLAMVATMVATALGGAALEMVTEEGVAKTMAFGKRHFRRLWGRISKNEKLGREELARSFMLKGFNNWRRMCPKISPDVLSRLRPLSQFETRAHFRDAEAASYDELHEPNRWAGTVQNRIFESILVVSNKGVVVAEMPNGIVGVFHEAAGITTSYLAHRADLAFDEGVPIPDTNQKLFKGGGVQKITHKWGSQHFHRQILMKDDFAQEVLGLLEADDDEARSCIKELFDDVKDVGFDVPLYDAEFQLAEHPDVYRFDLNGSLDGVTYEVTT